MRFRSFHGQNEALAAGDGKATVAAALEIGAEIKETATALAESYEDAAAQTETEAEDSASLVVTIAATTGIASLLLGLGLAVLIARSIRGPILLLTEAMGALARGDLGVAVPRTDEPNEIGAMARSVLVFKDNAVERARLELEAGASRSAGEAERERVAAERARAAEAQAEAVRRLGEGLRTLAAGDLTLRLGTGFSDEYAQIRDDFNEAIDKLKQTMLAVVASTRRDPVGRRRRFPRPPTTSRSAPSSRRRASRRPPPRSTRSPRRSRSRPRARAMRADVVAAADEDAKIERERRAPGGRGDGRDRRNRRSRSARSSG